MTTKKQRFTVSLDDNHMQKLETMTGDLQLSKSQLVAKLIDKKGRPRVQYRELDSQKINQCLNQLQEINNQLRRIGNNLNQYQHAINKSVADGLIDKNSILNISQPAAWINIPDLQQQVDAAIKKLSKYVNY